MGIAASGHVTAPVTLADGRTVAFVLDTGAQGTAVYDRFAREQALPADSTPMELTGQTGQASLTAVRLAEVTFDGTTTRDVVAVRLPDRADGVALAGIAGLDIFGRGTLTMDYRRMRAALAPAGVLRRTPGAIAATRLPSELLTVPVRVNGYVGIAVVDTGARETRVNTAFARAAGLTMDAGAAPTTIHGATNNAIVLHPARARSVVLGRVALGPRRVLVGDLPVFKAFGVADRPAMILGSDYLAGRRLRIDFPAARVWID